MILRRCGMEFIKIIDARRDALPEAEQALWGRYYDNKPATGVVDVMAAYNQVSRRGVGRYSLDEMTITVRERKAG
jgi:hypothetical protein